MRSPRVLSSLPAFPLALRSRAHLRRLRYSGHAPSACLASLGITTKTIFCIISSLRMWKRGFSTISAQKLQASRARAVRAPLPVQKNKFLYNSLAPYLCAPMLKTACAVYNKTTTTARQKARNARKARFLSFFQEKKRAICAKKSVRKNGQNAQM